MAKLKDTEVDGNLYVSGDIQVGDTTVVTETELDNKLSTKVWQKDWLTPTTVGQYSRLCEVTGYTNFLLSICLSQTAQVAFYTFAVGTSHTHANITQICGSGYSLNDGQEVRITTNNNTTFYIEVKNNYGANGATSVHCRCRVIPLVDFDAHRVNLTSYSAYTPTNSSCTVVSTVTARGKDF